MSSLKEDRPFYKELSKREQIKRENEFTSEDEKKEKKRERETQIDWLMSVVAAQSCPFQVERIRGQVCHFTLTSSKTYSVSLSISILNLLRLLF